MSHPFSDLHSDTLSDTTASFALPTDLLQLPSTLLDTLVPGYSLVAKFLLDQLGIDISSYVSLIAIAFAVLTAVRYAVAPVMDFALESVSSSVVVLEWDGLYDQILYWVSSQRNLQNLRCLRGRSPGQEYDSDDSDNEDALIEPDGDLGSDAIFNFTDWSARAPPMYEPHESSGWFRHNGYWFKISRDNDRLQGEYSQSVREREKIQIMVLWRSAKPIKRLIDDARERWLSRYAASTKIRRPAPKEQRSSYSAWRTITMRPTRPMSTVVLDDEQKVGILQDINDFLKPKTARWYANRGIPYRRGYLFHGPPGTGKSSLSFSIAGLFGLDIYCLSLTEITLTEEDLILLFNTLPKRCVVLLEDIDCAGVSRPEPRKKGSKRKKSKKSRKNRKSKKESDSSDSSDEDDASLRRSPKLKNAITISGLLNAIDGVASQEGRVLIMTTNYPDKLDSALIRPGRCDLKIGFKLASKQQAKELFLRMYRPDVDEKSKHPTKMQDVLPKVQDKETGRKSAVEDPQMEVLARQFADLLPDEAFSPAELQGYLLVHKKSAAGAVAGVATWRDGRLAERNTKAGEFHMEEQAKDANEVKAEALPDVEQASASAIAKRDPKQHEQKPATKVDKKHKRGEKTGSESSDSDSSGSGSDSSDSDSSSS